jgi:hypothetical protein
MDYTSIGTRLRVGIDPIQRHRQALISQMPSGKPRFAVRRPVAAASTCIPGGNACGLFTFDRKRILRDGTMVTSNMPLSQSGVVMTHYGLLRDYRFANAVHDIRGAALYGSSDEPIGTMDDIVFDHASADIRYVVVNVGDHKILVPSGNVYRSFREDGFETDLSKAEALALPVFDEGMLESDKQWTKHEKVHLNAWHKRVEQFEKDYQKSYSGDPVEHREGSDHFVTPGPSDMPRDPAKVEPNRVIYGADLTPQRIRDKFSRPSHPMFLSNTTEASSRTTMSISREAPERYHDASPRWLAFQDDLKTHADQIRRQCPACAANKAA